MKIFTYIHSVDKNAKVFLGTSDTAIIRNLDRWTAEIGPAETMAGVIGGFACFSLIEKIRPQKVVLFDRSPVQVGIYRLARALVEMAESPEEFLARFLSRADFLREDRGEKKLLQETLGKLSAHPEFEPLWNTTLAALAESEPLAKGVYVTPHTNDGRPLFVEDPAQSDLESAPLKKHLDHLPLSLFYGRGWLQNRKSFAYLKERLFDGTVAAMALKIQRLKLFKPYWSPTSNLLWVSNIGFFERWRHQPAGQRLDFLRRVPINSKILTSDRLLTPVELLDF